MMIDNPNHIYHHVYQKRCNRITGLFVFLLIITFLYKVIFNSSLIDTSAFLMTIFSILILVIALSGIFYFFLKAFISWLVVK